MNKEGIGFGLFTDGRHCLASHEHGNHHLVGIASLRVLWPLIIIAVGINMMFRNRTVKATWLLTAAIVIGTDTFTRSRIAAKETGDG